MPSTWARSRRRTRRKRSMKATKLFDIPPSLTSHHRGAPDRGSEARQQGQIKGIAMQGPISFTDDQLSMIVIAAQPIPPSHRAMFLEAVAARLHGQEVGDG